MIHYGTKARNLTTLVDAHYASVIDPDICNIIRRTTYFSSDGAKYSVFFADPSTKHDSKENSSSCVMLVKSEMPSGEVMTATLVVVAKEELKKQEYTKDKDVEVDTGLTDSSHDDVYSYSNRKDFYSYSVIGKVELGDSSYSDKDLERTKLKLIILLTGAQLDDNLPNNDSVSNIN